MSEYVVEGSRRELISLERFAYEINRMIQASKDTLKEYKKNCPEFKSSRLKPIRDSISHNKEMIMIAYIEKDTTIFYLEDGLPSMMKVSPNEKDFIYRRYKDFMAMIV